MKTTAYIILMLLLKSDLRGIETYQGYMGHIHAAWLKSDLRGIETYLNSV